ncbi:hypothetical protein PIB30_052912 [Stylosanthes scabra]|uniref:Uncharacterized protein n=1 Tax=Stylosanthes scabra TaxID=79078 RepID=A0ABU6UHR9_9FABA|nr:hypothetical protein [Stylosanthes scabra]
MRGGGLATIEEMMRRSLWSRNTLPVIVGAPSTWNAIVLRVSDMSASCLILSSTIAVDHFLLEEAPTSVSLWNPVTVSVKFANRCGISSADVDSFFLTLSKVESGSSGGGRCITTVTLTSSN